VKGVARGLASQRNHALRMALRNRTASAPSQRHVHPGQHRSIPQLRIEGRRHRCLLGVGAADDYNTCGVRSNGTLSCWGFNRDGHATPPAGTFMLRSVEAGHHHGCGVESDGTLTCWGDNSVGQAAPPSGLFAQVGSGLSDSCCVGSVGALA